MKLGAGWPLQPLVKVVEILDARRVPVKASDRAALGGTVPYYGATGQAGTIDRAIYNEPLVLLGEDGAPFFDPTKPKAFLIDGPAWVNNHAHVLRPLPHLDRRFLKHYLDAFDYRGFANGTTRLKLTQAAMRRIPVPMPPATEQRRIVEILEVHLSHLDAASMDLARARARLDSLIEAALRCHFKSDTATRPLADVLEMPLANGRSVPSRDDGFPVLRLTALKEGGVDLAERKGGAWERADAMRFLVRRGDFLIARGNGSLRLVGKGSLVRSEPDEVAFPDTVIRARPRPVDLSPEFLDLVWNARATRDQIERVARTSAGIYKVNQGQLGAIQLPVPAPSEQRSIIAAMDRLRDHRQGTLEAIDVAAQRNRGLRRAVLAAAFDGKLTGRHTDEEVIEELAGA
ncbi:hypothetical protein GCM10022199_25880 [Marihabitans asiaticum]|uniref:Type I restriction enzyme S subunit n=1 Tax=Marihabitans asiaticum TaxID=415218 RepID=A0A560WGG0_9MICO|nr:restriction endonuclease subunit S [Marihabitans asiaticum]TWD16773.1 type I restriction enzyme S subunit [Marihabitans asiaticum]